MIDRWLLDRAAGMPALFIVGAPRCGTTSLAGALAQHSRVAFSAPKEPHFFTALSDPIDPAATRRHYLEGHFPHLASEHRVLAEGSVSTLYEPAAITRIQQCFPEARFIVMLRNPLDMLPSYHGRLLFLLDEDQRDFRTAWSLQSERAAGRRLPRGCRDPNLLRYDRIGRLGAAVESLFAVARADRCHIIVHDDYVHDSRRVLNEVLELVGLQSGTLGPIKRRNVHRTYRYRWLQRLLRRPNKTVAKVVTQARKHQPATRETRLIPRSLQKIKRWNVRPARRAPLDPELRAELVATYRDDIAKLSQLIGRDLSGWLEDRPLAPPATITQPERPSKETAPSRQATAEKRRIRA